MKSVKVVVHEGSLGDEHTRPKARRKNGAPAVVDMSSGDVDRRHDNSGQRGRIDAATRLERGAGPAAARAGRQLRRVEAQGRVEDAQKRAGGAARGRRGGALRARSSEETR